MMKFFIAGMIIQMALIQSFCPQDGEETIMKPREIRQPELIKIFVDRSRVVFTVDPRYYSFALGANLDFMEKINLSSPILKSLAKELAPAYLRLGGSMADFIIFCADCDEAELDVGRRTFTNVTLTGKVWNELNSFLSEVGWNLVFDVNVFLRTPDDAWDPTNFKKLLDFNSERGFHVNFQLGNEPNAFPGKFNRTISPHQLAEDFETLRLILSQQKLYQNSLVIGPDTTNLIKKLGEYQLQKKDAKDYLIRFLDNVGNTTDVTSTHFYYPPKPGTRNYKDYLTDPMTLDLLRINSKQYNDVVAKYRPPDYQRMWYGESGVIPGGQMIGSKNILMSYICGMVWLDRLGLGALQNIEVFIRQTFIAGESPLLSNNYIPYPSYWVAVLYKQLVGPEALQLSVGHIDGNSSRVRLYAHCTNRSKYGYDPGAVTVFGVNFSKTKNVRLSFSTSHADQFLLTPPNNESILSKHIALNGHELSSDGGSLPEMPPQVLSTTPVMPPRSMGFFVLKDVSFEVCTT